MWPYESQGLTTSLVWLSRAAQPWHSPKLSRALNGSLVRTSKAPWRAQLLTPASLLNLAHHPHHHHGCAPKALWCLNVHPVCTGASQTWCCCRRRYASLSPRQRQIWRASSISVIIRCSGCFHMLWHSTGRWCSRADVCCLLHGECQRCAARTSCGFHALYGHETLRGLQGRFRFSEKMNWRHLIQKRAEYIPNSYMSGESKVSEFKVSCTNYGSKFMFL